MGKVFDAATVKDAVSMIDIANYYGVKSPGRGKQLRVKCPFHQDQEPSMRIYTDRHDFYCFGCHAGGDIFSFIMKKEGCSFPEAVQKAAEIGGLSEFDGAWGHKESGNERKISRSEKTADYTEYYRECEKRLNAPEAVAYLQKRGISFDTAKALRIGYDSAADPASAPGGKGRKRHPCPRIIFPSSVGHYVGRSIDPNTDEDYVKMNPKGSTPGIFNREALYALDVREVFVTEGGFDALSVIEAGADAIALNSTANAAQLLKMLKDRRTEATLILCLDDDESGRRAEAELHEGLQRLNIDHVSADILCGQHDPNDALTADRGAFFAVVADIRKRMGIRE